MSKTTLSVGQPNKLARHNKKKDKSSNSGFTLVELIVVVVILAIIIGVTIAGIYKYVNKSRINTDINNASAMQKVISTLQADKEVNKAFSTLSTGSKLEIKWSDAQNINVDGENANITAADSEGTPAIIDAGISRDFIKKVAELLPDGLPESKAGGTFYITIEKSADNEMVYNVHSTSTLDTSEPTIPNGDTITTLNDVQTWLKCAGITNKNYTTVAEVCSDDEVLTALMDNENAMTYLTRSTDFATDICSNELAMTRLGDSKYCDDSVLNSDLWVSAISNSTYMDKIFTELIPAMTSNTTPSGIASCSSVWAGASEFLAWHAFNRVSVSNDMWEADGRTSQWLQYEFPNNVKSYILEIDLSSAYANDKRYTDPYYLQVSSDGTNWENILTVTPTYDEIVQLTRYKIETPTSSKYYRWYFPLGCVQGTYRYTHVTRAQLYGR